MTSAKKDVLEELKEHHLTRVLGRKPTAQDVELWEEETAEIATLIKTSSIQGGLVHGHLAIVIPQDEYQLEIEDEDWDYEEPTKGIPSLHGSNMDCSTQETPRRICKCNCQAVSTPPTQRGSQANVQRASSNEERDQEGMGQDPRYHGILQINGGGIEQE